MSLRAIGRLHIVCFLIVVFLVLTAAAVHTDFDGRSQPTCPACQLERNIGCLSLAFSFLAILPDPVQTSIPVELQFSEPKDQPWIRVPSSRSPPV